MNWLNIQTTFLRSPEFMGCDPVQRATWLALLGFCCEQENGGRIKNCSQWGDRRWQQTCGVTLQEIQMRCDLWSWDGDDVLLFAYPSEKEAEVKGKRQAGAKGGKASGKARKKTANEAQREAELQAQREALLQAELERKGKGKGMEGEEKENRKINKARGTREEVDEFFRSLGLAPRDAEYMWHNWQDNGWTIKGKPIKDWKATVRKWKAAGHLPSQKNPSTSDYWPAISTPEPEKEEEPFHVIFARNKAKRDAEQGVDPDVPPTAEEISEMQEEIKW